MSEPEMEDSDANFYTLKLFLIGRICIVEYQPDEHVDGKPAFAALFLNARHNLELGARKHRPLMYAPLRRMENQAAEDARVSFCNAEGRASGLWSIKGYDLAFNGLTGPPVGPDPGPDPDLAGIPDLNRIYAAVDPQAEWLTREELLDRPDPRMHGVATRLSLRGFTTIEACNVVQGNERPLTFLPGRVEQTIKGGVLCTGKFRKATVGPSLEGPAFNQRRRRRALNYKFEGEGDLTLTMSNLCTCAAHTPTAPTGYVGGQPLFSHDDGEFRVYYDLLAQRPSKDHRPIPCGPLGTGAGSVAECYDTGRVVIKNGG